MGAFISCCNNVETEQIERQNVYHRTPAYQPPKPNADFIFPAHKNNSKLEELKKNLARSRLPQNAIRNIEIFDQRSQSAGLKNKDLVTGVASNNRDTHRALERKASFLMVRDILGDIATSKKELEYPSRVQDDSRLLLTAQVEALHTHVLNGKAEIERKIVSGERVCPLVMSREGFKEFLEEHQLKLELIVRSCRLAGVYRKPALEHNLRKLSIAYLTKTNRLPSYSPGEPFTSCPSGGPLGGGNPLADGFVLDDRDGPLGIRIDEKNYYGAFCVVNDETQANGAGSLIVMAREEHPFADPANGRPSEKLFVSGFENCTIEQKQAAAFILDLFNNLGCLELEVAHYNGKKSNCREEGKTAFLSDLDSTYFGSEEIGDYNREAGHDDRRHQRKPLVDSVSGLGPLARNFNRVNPNHELLTDPGLNKWVQSGQFEKDLEGLSHPETRAWTLNVERTKEALLRNPIFSPRAPVQQVSSGSHQQYKSDPDSRTKIKSFAIDCYKALERNELSDFDLKARLKQLDQLSSNVLSNDPPVPTAGTSGAVGNAGAYAVAGAVAASVVAAGFLASLHGIPVSDDQTLAAAQYTFEATYGKLQPNEAAKNFKNIVNSLSDKEISDFMYAYLLCRNQHIV